MLLFALVLAVAALGAISVLGPSRSSTDLCVSKQQTTVENRAPAGVTISQAVSPRGLFHSRARSLFTLPPLPPLFFSFPRALYFCDTLSHISAAARAKVLWCLDILSRGFLPSLRCCRMSITNGIHLRTCTHTLRRPQTLTPGLLFPCLSLSLPFSCLQLWFTGCRI